MGVGIAQVAAQTKKVILLDANPQQVSKGLKFINVLLEKDVLKGKITSEEKTAILSRLSATQDINVDLVHLGSCSS